MLAAACGAVVFSKSPEELSGSRIALFSYGSGLASSLFSVRVAAANGCGARLDDMVSGRRPAGGPGRDATPPRDGGQTITGARR